MYKPSTLAAILVGATLVAGAVFPEAASADPPPWAGVWKHAPKPRHYHGMDDYRVVYVPVPAVREARLYPQRAAPVAQGLPYGFNRGTCDRSLISSELMGAVLGGSIGRAMDNVDQGCIAGMLDHVPDRRAISWAGEAGHSYRVQPVRSFETEGRYCREYQAMAVIGGRQQQTYGTACRMPDGQWAIMD